MSRAVAQAAPLKPEIRLAQAISEFEACLAQDEKAKFQRYRHEKPDALDVFRLTADIDSNEAQRRYSRKFVGSRLTSVLQSVQEFTSIVDVVVGTSQNSIAGAMWGVVKLSIQLALGISSFFEKLSTLLDGIGRDAPRFQQFGSLFHQSKSLQKSLCEYYIAVCKLCQKSVTVLKRPGLLQVPLNAMLSSDFQLGSFKADLQTKASEIQRGVELLSEQASKEEREESSRFRALSAKISTSTALEVREAKIRRKHKVKRALLDSLSKYNHETVWRREMKRGSPKWIQTVQDYVQWKSSDQSSILWCKGSLGSGKTILAARIVEDLKISMPQELVSFFFCAHDDAESLKFRTVLGSIARQFILQCSERLPEQYLQWTKCSLNLDDIDKILQETLPSRPKKLFIILDGLEECPAEEIRLCYETLANMLKSAHTFKVLFTSRPDALEFVEKISGADLKVLSFSNFKDKRNAELEEYITNELESRWEEGTLRVGSDPKMLLRIHEKLRDKADGMFLWVSLQFDYLCAQLTDKATLQAIEDLPRGLERTYNRLLEKAASQYSGDDRAGDLFLLVISAQRPLTLIELQDALGVEIGVTSWDPAGQIRDIYQVLQQCGSLLSVDESEMTVHFTHSSVKKHLLSPDSYRSLDYGSANDFMGDICVTYLSSERFNTALIKPPQEVSTDTQSTDYVSHIINATGEGQRKLGRAALKLLRTRARPEFDLRSHLQRASELSNPSSDIQGPLEIQTAFKAYAERFWLHHTKTIREQDNKAYHLWVRLVDGCVPFVSLPWHEDHVERLSDPVNEHSNQESVGEKDSKRQGIGHYLIQERHSALLRLRLRRVVKATELWLLPLRKSFENEKHGLNPSPNWFYFPQLTNDQFEQILPDDAVQEYLLFGVLRFAQVPIEYVLRQKPELAYSKETMDRCLSLAFQRGQLGIIRQIQTFIIEHLRSRLEVYEASSCYRPGSPVRFFQWFAGVAIGAGSTLCEACGLGEDDLAEFLLQNGADPNAGWEHDGRVISALHEATRFCSVRTVSKLLKCGANVDAFARDIGTPLQAACHHGHTYIAEKLLKHNANVNEVGPKYGTALYAASARKPENVELVKTLLESGARDVGGATGPCGSAIDAAQDHGNREVRKILCQWYFNEHSEDYERPEMRTREARLRESQDRASRLKARPLRMEPAVCRFNQEAARWEPNIQK